jgi:hypothetical protein
MIRNTRLNDILMKSQGQQLLGGFLFAVLLNFKHIYMYLAVRDPYTLPYTTCD